MFPWASDRRRGTSQHPPRLSHSAKFSRRGTSSTGWIYIKLSARLATVRSGRRWADPSKSMSTLRRASVIATATTCGATTPSAEAPSKLEIAAIRAAPQARHALKAVALLNLYDKAVPSPRREHCRASPPAVAETTGHALAHAPGERSTLNTSSLSQRGMLRGRGSQAACQQLAISRAGSLLRVSSPLYKPASAGFFFLPLSNSPPDALTRTPRYRTHEDPKTDDGRLERSSWIRGGTIAIRQPPMTRIRTWPRPRGRAPNSNADSAPKHTRNPCKAAPLSTSPARKSGVAKGIGYVRAKLVRSALQGQYISSPQDHSPGRLPD